MFRTVSLMYDLNIKEIPEFNLLQGISNISNDIIYDIDSKNPYVLMQFLLEDQ